ncbi:MAG: glycosyltransferase family 4 protein [Tannerellaceae bacterium]|nr:glycosyltransferase family 4 protein [Tannerellaceae bacterium]
MKVLLLNTFEQTGGAAVATNRLLSALRKENVEACMLVRDKDTKNPYVVSVNTSWIRQKINFIRFLWERLIIFLCNNYDRETVFQLSIANTGTDISRHPLVKEADIIHLSWINQGFLSLKDIKKLTQLGKPVVWTMHDMWPCTGGCHYPGDCKRYEDKCHCCFLLSSAGKNDLSFRIFSQKEKIIKKADLTFAGCSNWITQQAQKSALLRNKQICNIPNPINTAVFSPATDKLFLRKTFGLPDDKQLLLFGALSLSDKRKGIDYLIEAIRLIPQKENMAIVVFGQAKEEIKNMFQIPVYSMGYLRNEKRIAELYNTVDVFVTPSLEDNLPNTIMEAMACGTPCVGFNVGGIPEMIDHKITGYLATYKDVEDLANGIQWVLGNKNSANLSEACLKKVQENYAESIVALKYVELYQNLLSNN